MKRYDIEGLSKGQYKYTEDPNGEWVRYEDVDALIMKTYKEGYFTGHNSASLAEPWQRKVVGSECNCADVSSGMIEGGLAPEFPTHPSWICPAHGYKRL